MKLPPILFALLLLGFYTPAKGQEYEARTFTAATGETLPYRLLHPPSQQPGAKVPLVIFFHGAGERGTDNEAQLRHGAPLFAKPDVQKAFPAFVMAPQCPPEHRWVDMDWSAESGTQPELPSGPMRLALGALDEVLSQHPEIDQDRIYVTGLSMGGFATWDLITRFPQRFAAAVPICGGGDVAKAALAKNVAIWAFHGDEDPTVKVERTRTMIAKLQEAGAQPLYTEYAGVKHDSWTLAYGEPLLLSWLFAQKRGVPPVPWAAVAEPTDLPPTSLFPSQGPVQPGLWFRQLWKEKRTEWAQSVERDQQALVFLGDSITQGWGTLARDFPTMKIANRGISGDTTRGVLYRLKEDVISLKPRAVALLIGTNDIGLGGSPEVAAENVRIIISQLRASDPKMPIIVSRVMPADASNNRPANKIQRLNALVDQIVDTDPLAVRVDTYTLFANEEGNARKEEFPDLLHPNAAAYARWAEILRPIFKKLGLEYETD